MVGTPVPDGLLLGWSAALLAGLVVALVVVVLLHALYREVRGIEDAFAEVWEMGKQVARNTATTWMFGQTARLLGEVDGEALAHDAFLGGKEA